MVDVEKTVDVVLEQLNKYRDQIDRLNKIAPDAVPTALKAIMVSSSDPKEKLTTLIGELETDESRASFLSMLNLSLEGMTKELAKFEESLRERIHPEGKPREKRKIKQFKKRKGTW